MLNNYNVFDMDAKTLRTQSLDLLRFPLAIIIVVIHTFSINDLTIRGAVLPLKSMPVFVELNYWIDGFLRGQSVPVYYFISGFVFFLGVTLTKEKYCNKLQNRVHTLLIPYIIWNIVAVGFTLLKRTPALSSFFPATSQTSVVITPFRLLNVFWNATNSIIVVPGAEIANASSHAIFPFNVALWFLRDLMIVVLMTPLIYVLIKRFRFIPIVTLGITWFFEPLFFEGYICQITTALFFFSLGAYFSILQKDIIYEFNKFFKYSIIAYLLFGVCYVFLMHICPEAANWVKQLNVLCGLLFAYNISSYLIKNGICKANKFFSSSSFYIYVTHTIINIEVLKVILIVLKPSSDIAIISSFIISIIVTVGMLLLSFVMMKKYTPRFLTFITGRK